MATKYVYFFGNGDAEGDESMRPILGGKGANLAQMAKAPLSLASAFHCGLSPLRAQTPPCGL